MRLLRWPPWLSHDLLLLFGARAFRSLAQGFLGIIVPLYLAALGYQATAMGLLFAISAITGALMAAAVGFLADRFGRKPFLVIIALLMAVGSLVFAVSHNFVVMVAAAALGTIGYAGAPGLGGGWGPYYPAAQSLVAEQGEANQRTAIFGALSFVGVIAGALGSLLAMLPGVLHRTHGLTMVAGYRGLFLLTAVLGVAMAVIVLPIREVRYNGTERPSQPNRKTKHGELSVRRVFGMSKATWLLVIRFMITNATNGLAIGMLGPFVVYWFYREFGANATQLARLYFLIGLLAAVPYLLAARMTQQFGTVSTIVGSRVLSSVLLVVMALMPTFTLAALVYTVRMLTNVLSVPVRQSYLMGVIEPAERATAAGLANLPSQATRSASSYFAGYLMQHVALAMPLELAGGLQALNALLYHLFFHNVHPPEERVALAEGDAAAGD